MTQPKPTPWAPFLWANTANGCSMVGFPSSYYFFFFFLVLVVLGCQRPSSCVQHLQCTSVPLVQMSSTNPADGVSEEEWK